MTTPEKDPFAPPPKSPAMSFKNEPIGTVKAITVTEPAVLKQTLNYNTQEPDFWPVKNPGETPKPKMAAVVAGVDEHGEPCSVWAPLYPKALFEAIQAAQKAIGEGYRLKPGDVLAVKYTGDGEKTAANKEAPKLYAAKITPAPEPQAADAFGDEPPF